jgi:hypothetical protein
VMHLGITLFLEVGLFSYVAIVGLTLFLPAKFWESIARRLRRATPPVGQAAQTQSFSVTPSRLARLPQTLCMVFLVYVLAVNLNTLPGQPLKPLSPEKWKPFGTGLGLRQRWGMFEAIPSRDGWYVARAKLRDGSEVDLLRAGAPVEWERPEFPAGVYPNHYWQKLFREMAYDDEQGFQLLRAPVAKFLCRKWNAQNTPARHVAEFEFVYCSVEKDLSRNGPAQQLVREPLLRLRF